MNMELLKELCNNYGFTYNEIGCYILINSKRDSWYIENIDYTYHKITLYHANTRGNAYMHSHGKHEKLEDIFKCIYSHDNREMNRNNKMIKLTTLYNMIN